MSDTVRDRLAALRGLMHQRGLGAVIIPSTDPHQSEYVARHWASREWLSGFTGSAGTLAITQSKAGLWTDSRYFLQAGDQLRGTGIELFRLKVPGTPSIASMLAGCLSPGSAVGIDGDMFSCQEAEALETQLRALGLELRLTADPMAAIWKDRPAIPDAPARVHDALLAGRAASEKMDRVREIMARKGIDCLVVSALDEIAWLLNLRGTDVHCNPVVISYAVLMAKACHVFMAPWKCTGEVRRHLLESGCTLHGYEEIKDFLRTLDPALAVGYAPSQMSVSLRQALPPSSMRIPAPSIIQLLKSIKTAAEAEGARKAMLRDGVAMTRFLIWLERELPKGGLTELSVVEKLHELRSAEQMFLEESFDTIAGFGPHGAIVHYEPTAQTNVPLEQRSFLLVDSGGQYMDGTTDITRTIPLGTLSWEERVDYTLILKGNLAMAMAVFPEGTRGSQLDILARLPLWKQHQNYLHGTGHGVGSCLCVHEGPQSVRMEENPVPLMAGMTVTDEPGIYKEGKYGIRTENVLLVVPSAEGMFGSYLRFEILTLCPIATAPLILEMLSGEERAFLNSYHERTYVSLAPLLSEGERQWLRKATRPV